MPGKGGNVVMSIRRGGAGEIPKASITYNRSLNEGGELIERKKLLEIPSSLSRRLVDEVAESVLH